MQADWDPAPSNDTSPSSPVKNLTAMLPSRNYLKYGLAFFEIANFVLFFGTLNSTITVSLAPIIIAFGRRTRYFSYGERVERIGGRGGGGGSVVTSSSVLRHNLNQIPIKTRRTVRASICFSRLIRTDPFKLI